MSGSGQDSLRKVVYGDNAAATEKKKTERKKADTPKKTAANAAAPKVKKPAAGTTQKKRTDNTSTTRRSVNRRPGWITVTFESKEPNTQIYLNGNPVGATDDTGKFQWNMTPGAYRVSGTLNANTVFTEKLIQIRKNEMTIRVFEEIAAKPPEEQPLIIPKTQAEIEMELAREMSLRVLQIFSDYLDPNKSEHVTADDWQFAANAAVLGDFQNLSRQQIEAQRKFAAGQVALAGKKYNDAFTEFRLAAQSFQGSPLPHIGLGDAYFAAAQWQDARRSYEQARGINPGFWMAHRRLGDTYRILGEQKKAILAYADAIKFGDDRYETRYLRVRTIVDAEQMENAIPILDELLKEGERSEIYLALGEAFEKLKRDIGALDHYRKAVELDPESPVAQYRLARIYYEQREYQKAYDGFDAALKLDAGRKTFSIEDAAEKRLAAQLRIKR